MQSLPSTIRVSPALASTQGPTGSFPPSTAPRALMAIRGLRQHPREDAWGIGVPRAAQRSVDAIEKTLKVPSRSTRTGPLHLRPGELYVYVVDPLRGLTYARERDRPDQDMPTRSGGVTHPMLVDASRQASIGGEMLMRDGTLYFNAQSGRYSRGTTNHQLEAVKVALENLSKGAFSEPFQVVLRDNLDRA